MTSKRTALIALVASASVAGCVVDYPLVNDLLSFEITFAASTPDQPTGTQEDRLEFVSGGACSSDAGCSEGQACVSGPEGSICSAPYVFDVTAYGRDGEPFPYTGPLALRLTPGIVADGNATILMTDGKLEGLEVYLARSFGHTHVWIEADGYWPRPDSASYGSCSDGLDNDRNGLVDLADPGCRDETDDIEAPVNLASGISPSLWFADPNLRDLQHADPIVISTSPLVGEQVQVSRGNLVVTNVVNNGFYVVDLEHNQADVLFTSLFVFTYSKPKELLYGDRLCGFSGAVQEHVGHTQVVFPTFEVYHPEPVTGPPCSTPGPTCVEDSQCETGWDCCETNTAHAGSCAPLGTCDVGLCETGRECCGPDDDNANICAPEGTCNQDQWVGWACHDFPGFDPDAEVPEPWDVTDLLVQEDRTDSANYKPNVWANSQLLEAHESNLVTFRDVVISTRFIACDRNGDGQVSGDDEKTCRNGCTRDDGGVLCTDLEGYFQFAQYAGMVGTDKKKVYGSVALAASFKPLDIETIGGPDLSGRCTVDITDDGFVEYLCEPVTLEHLTGSLRHIYLCGDYSTEDQCDLQFWVIDPRFDDDVVIAQPNAGSTPDE